MTRRILLLITLSLLVNLTILFAQNIANREYGSGIVLVRNPYSTSLTFFSKPLSNSDTVAIFHAETLMFVKDNYSVRSFGQMIELSYTEIGFPIIEFNRDSSWIHVSLNCLETKNPPTGWIPHKPTILTAKSWTDILGNRTALFFLKKEWISFFSKPDTRSKIDFQLFSPTNGEANYILKRKRIQGRWMQVEIETPSTFCSSDEEILQQFGTYPKRRTVWIQFLDEQGRPRVFYYARGC